MSKLERIVIGNEASIKTEEPEVFVSDNQLATITAFPKDAVIQ